MSNTLIEILVVITLIITITLNIITEVNNPKKVKGDSKKWERR